MKIKFGKINSGAKIPCKNKENAGFDIYCDFVEEQMVIYPNETKMIPTGIASAFSPKYAVMLKERGSTGSKGIGQRCGVIDSGYRGQWFCCVTNHNNIPIIITKKYNKNLNDGNAIYYDYNKAICQGIVVKVPKLQIKEAGYEEIIRTKSERGKGKLGSSGK